MEGPRIRVSVSDNTDCASIVAKPVTYSYDGNQIVFSETVGTDYQWKFLLIHSESQFGTSKYCETKKLVRDTPPAPPKGTEAPKEGDVPKEIPSDHTVDPKAVAEGAEKKTEL